MTKRFYDFILFNPSEKEANLIRRMGWSGLGLILDDLRMLDKRVKYNVDLNVLYFIQFDKIKDLPLSIKTQTIIYDIAKTASQVMNYLKKKEIRVVMVYSSRVKDILTNEIVNVFKQHPDKLLLIAFSDILHQQKIHRIITSIRKSEKMLYKLRGQILFGTGASSFDYMTSPRILRSFLREIGIRECVILLGVSVNPSRLFFLPNPIVIKNKK